MNRRHLLASLLAAPMMAVASRLGMDERPKVVDPEACARDILAWADAQITMYGFCYTCGAVGGEVYGQYCDPSVPHLWTRADLEEWDPLPPGEATRRALLPNPFLSGSRIGKSMNPPRRLTNLFREAYERGELP